MNMLEFNQLFGTDQSLNTSNEELDIECFLEANEELHTSGVHPVDHSPNLWD